MDKDAVIREFGSLANLAERLGYTRAAVSRWFAGDRVPYYVQCMIQVETAGKLRADHRDKPRPGRAA